MGELDSLKIVRQHLIDTGFREKYDELVDKVIYKVSSIINESGENKVTFSTNVGEYTITIPAASLDNLIDVDITNATSGQVLTYNGSNWQNSPQIIPALATLTDVDLTNPTTGQSLVFDGNNWVNTTPATTLDSLTDVITTHATSGDALIFNGSNWVNGQAYHEDNDYTSTTFISDGDPYVSTISTLDEILALLAPAKPGNLSTKVLDVVGKYTSPGSIIQTKTGSIRTYVTDDQTPLIQFNTVNPGTPSTNNGAYNAASGTLSSTLIKEQGTNNITSTSTNITFTSADETGAVAYDSGSNFSLNVSNDIDYHFGVAGKAGFWRAFFANVQLLNNLNFYPNEQHNVAMTHSATGSTNITVFIDNPVTPSLSSPQVSTTATGSTKISGVPTLVTSDPIRCQYNVNNAIKTFYAVAIANVNSSITNTVTTNESGIKTYNAVYTADLSPVIQSGRYTEDLSMTLNGYNSKYQTLTTGNSATTTATIATTQSGKTMRIDTVSNESARKKSGSGQYPASGYGATYDSTESLLTNEEIQMIAGNYRYPYLDHTTNYPVAGPNYTTISGWRYVTFVLPIVAKQNIIITFNGATNFGSINQVNNTMTTSVWRLNVKVDGSSNWIDGNAAYVSGNPSADGAAGMVVAASSQTVKTVTFGTATYTGNCYVRIGLHDTAKAFPIMFTGATITAS